MQDIVGTAFPRCRLVDVQPFADGFRNANFKLRLDSIPGFVVLRIYEHDPSLCAKEVDLLNLIKYSVPVLAIIHAELEGLNEIPPFVFMHYVEGISLRELKRKGDSGSIATIPATHTTCIGGGVWLGTPSERVVGGGTLLFGTLSNSNAVLSGTSWSFNVQITPFIGGQVIWNGSGVLCRPTAALVPGVALSGTVSKCTD